MATSSITIPTMRSPLRESKFLGQTHQLSTAKRSIFPHQSNVHQVKAMAKFNLWEVMGGRGLCNGEKGIEKELKRNIEDDQQPSQADNEKQDDSDDNNLSFKVPENGFDKEMMGLTGGFPGGEKGLRTFIEKNPPPPPHAKRGSDVSAVAATDKKPKAPELPLLMPGMIAIVKNQNSPYHMYCGIVQRITDGKAGVLFEGGNWDRLITFRLEELERREKGPPGKNPKSCILEPLIEQMKEEEAAP